MRALSLDEQFLSERKGVIRQPPNATWCRALLVRQVHAPCRQGTRCSKQSLSTSEDPDPGVPVDGFSIERFEATDDREFASWARASQKS